MGNYGQISSNLTGRYFQMNVSDLSNDHNLGDLNELDPEELHGSEDEEGEMDNVDPTVDEESDWEGDASDIISNSDGDSDGYASY
jgi:hypothetical protein